MPGYYTSRFLDSGKELDDLICCICLGVFRNPVVTQCCRQTYCEECIGEWVSQYKTCPNDRKSLTKEGLKPVPRALINPIDNLQIKCDYESEGCTQMVRIGDLANHLMVCNFGSNKLCKTCGLVKESVLTHNCIQSLICEKQKSDEKYLQLLMKSSSLVRIEKENEQETIQDLNLANKRWQIMLSISFIMIMVILIGCCLLQFLYVKQNDEMIDLLRKDLLQYKCNSMCPIESVILQLNETFDSFRRDLAQSLLQFINNQKSLIEKSKPDQERIEEKLNLTYNGGTHEENEEEKKMKYGLIFIFVVVGICGVVYFNIYENRRM